MVIALVVLYILAGCNEYFSFRGFADAVQETPDNLFFGGLIAALLWPIGTLFLIITSIIDKKEGV